MAWRVLEAPRAKQSANRSAAIAAVLAFFLGAVCDRMFFSRGCSPSLRGSSAFPLLQLQAADERRQSLEVEDRPGPLSDTKTGVIQGTQNLGSSENINGACQHRKLRDAILPILREWGCGHDNMETPKVLVRDLGGRMLEHVPFGRNRVVVDVGLGADAGETLHAVSEGFVTFSFEPDSTNMALLKAEIEGNPELQKKFHFVQLTPGSTPNFSTFPLPPPSGGFGYIYFAALANAVGAGSLSGAGNVGQVVQAESGTLPILTLDAALPPWAQDIFFMKLDTQGFELKVLQGASKILAENRARYILFEFSPNLMIKGALGNHTELVQLLPRLNYLCFDMMGTHQTLPRPSSPISAWEDDLLGWKHAYPGVLVTPLESAQYGPWDDIMCANWVKMLDDKA